jgi:four helix bundle protein
LAARASDLDPGPVRDHTSLVVWQRARTVTRGAIAVALHHRTPVAGPLIHQLQRAAVSVQLNIAEGHGLRSPALFRRHLRIAYGSAVETGDILALLQKFEVVPIAILAPMVAAIRDSQYLLLGLIRKLS